jgi:hypothetical protein
MAPKREVSETSDNDDLSDGDNYSPSPKASKSIAKREMSEESDEYHDDEETTPPTKTLKCPKTPKIGAKKAKITPKKAKAAAPPSSTPSQNGSQSSTSGKSGSPRNKFAEMIIECGIQNISKAEVQSMVSSVYVTVNVR